MEIKGINHFSENCTFSDINKYLEENERDNLIKAFQDRLEEFYFKPARNLNSGRYAFAAGVICVVTIDFLARIKMGLDGVRKRFEDWVKSNITEFDNPNPDNHSQILARRFYDEFRNGLVHEGRIKNAGKFSYDDTGELVKVEQKEMIINPECLLNAISESFKKYIDEVKEDESKFQAFKCVLIRDFQQDLEYARRR